MSFAQTSDKALPGLIADKIKMEIKLDGVLDEPIWQQEGWAEDFQQFFPSDTSLAKAQTRVKIAFDEKFLYIAAVMYNLGPRTPQEYVSTSLRRDYRGEQNDGVSFVLDTFNDYSSGFQFGINPFGVQRESLIAGLAALGLSVLTHLDLRSLTLGMMPGGIAEMSLTAETLQLSVPLVTAMQVMRLLFVLFLAEPLFRYWNRNPESS